MTEQQLETIHKIKRLGGYQACLKALDNLENLKVSIVGEPIIDIYRFVRPEGISSKSPTVSCRFSHEESYQGGSLAIFRHLDSFLKEGTQTINLHASECRKIRYISGTQRIFEVTEINENGHDLEQEARSLLNSKSDVVIAADFGHGLFEGPVLKAMEEVNGFIALNVQTNSSNFGFNIYDKHLRFDYLCLDTREARLATHDRYSTPYEVAKKILRKVEGKYFSLTTGPTGATLWKPEPHGYMWHEHTPYSSPAFSDVVVDATGAGDAYFAITSVLLATGCDPELVVFIGNVFASLKTKVIGNKRPITKDELLNVIEGLLECPEKLQLDSDSLLGQ